MCLGQYKCTFSTHFSCVLPGPPPGAQGPLNFTHRSCLRAQSREVSHRLSARTLYLITNDISKRWIDCALGSATGVYHVSKFNSSVRTISSPDITRLSSSSISCTSENDFSGFGTCAQHGNIGSQAVRAEPALLEKRIFSQGPLNFTHRSYLRARSGQLSHILSAHP